MFVAQLYRPSLCTDEMSMLRKFSMGLLLLGLALSACAAPSPEETPPTGAPATETTATPESTPPQPSATPTVALLDLEIIEWFEHSIPNLADPSITDTQIEVLVHNPNDVPVIVNTRALEFRLINAAGEVVYTNSSAYFSLWEGSWMLVGDSTGFQICACFESSGGEKQEWQTLEFSAPIEPATDVLYTMDIEASLGEPISLAEAHLGGSGTGIPITMTNTSDQALTSVPMRVIARDLNGRYIGMPAFGNSVASFTQNILIQPGDTAQGILPSEINYYDGPLTYEIVAIGIPASSTVDEVPLPSGEPADTWEGIPIMPGAIGGADEGSAYQFTVGATIDEITVFYESELAILGYTFENSEEQGGYTTLYFAKGTSTVLIMIVPLGVISGVVITTQ